MSAVQLFIARVTALVVLCASVTVWFGVAPPLAMAATRHRTLNDTRSFGSAPVSVGHAIDYFGLVADLDSPTTGLEDRGPTPFGEVRFLADGHWTPWQRLDQDGAQHEGQFTGSLIPVPHATAYQVRQLPNGAHNWRAAAINTTDGPVEVVSGRGPGEAVAAPNCRSRADWGADESLTKWSQGTDVQSFFPAQVLTVHHTAGSNSSTQDYSATMRAIYSYHIESNGWSDIAYHYLIDGKGVLYEGRSAGHTSRSCLTGGGDGSDFAHQPLTDHVVSGGHVYAQHGGNLGIALMGCYEDGACSGDTAVPSPSLGMLTTTLAMLARRHALDPLGRVHYVNPVSGATRDLATIPGHRDWVSTACPGGKLYAQLPAVRIEVARRLALPSSVPTATPRAVSTPEDTAVSITVSGSDPEGDPLVYAVQSIPAHGILTGAAPSLRYVPATDYHGIDSFSFTASDGLTSSAPATVTITVAPVNDAPSALDLTASTLGTRAVKLTLIGSDPDNDSLSYTVETYPDHGTLSGTAPHLTYAPAAGYAGSDRFTFAATDGTATSAPAVVDLTVRASVGPTLFIGSSTSGTAGGVSFADDDILTKDLTTGVWSLYFDGSDLGISSQDADAVEALADGSLLMSFTSAFTLSGLGSVDDSDIVRFVPSSTGPETSGMWEWYVDASDVGLTNSDEDVDAFSLLADGRIVVSTTGSASVSGVSAADEDLMVYTPARLGASSSGTWAMYFDGSDVGLASSSSEDVSGVWVDPTGRIHLSTAGSFSVSGASGDGSDIFTCAPKALGSTTACTFTKYWDGSSNGFAGEVTDSFSVSS